ncbi:MAG: hypothetical protein Q9217_003689, partial [Psora testacea]
LSVSASALLQAAGLINWLIFAPWRDRTPRQKWERQMSLPEIRWGTFYPLYTNLACISKTHTTVPNGSTDDSGLTYSIIAPLMLIFSVVTFGLFWFVFRYNLLYISAFPFDTRGRLYPTALKQLFTGIYMMELCLIGLFLSIRSDRDAFAGIGQAVIIMIATIFTVIYQLLLGNIFASILKYLPASTKDGGGQERKSKEVHSLRSALDPLHHLARNFYSWMMPSRKVSRDLQDSINRLARNQLKTTNQRGYKHKAADPSSPVIWIPRDVLGISEDEIAYANDCVSEVRISNELADLDMNG